jgi:hypothetical protein
MFRETSGRKEVNVFHLGYNKYERALREMYTGKYWQAEPGEGIVLSKQTSAWKVRIVSLDRESNTWDILLQAKSERQLSALLRRLELVKGVKWSRLNGEAYTRCSVFSLPEVLDILKFRRRKPLIGLDRLKRVDPLAPYIPLRRSK